MLDWRENGSNDTSEDPTLEPNSEPTLEESAAQEQLDARPGCPVCGCQDLYLDEVGPEWARGPRDLAGLMLGECQRCDYRWTMPLPAIRPLRRPRTTPGSAREHAA
jgi:hypothetical protein